VTPRRLLILALLPGVLLAPGAAAQRPPNVIGTLTRAGPATCPRDEPCDPPAAAAVLRFSRGGRVAASILASTRFRLRLAPGRYSISAAAPAAPRAVPGAGGGLVVRPSTLRVPRKGAVHPHLTLTSG
jgi:hypothetical protein